MSALPIARLLGFEIRIHVSWAIILAVVVVSVAAQVEAVAPRTEPLIRGLVGAVVAGAFLLSAVAHELGHAVAARRAGMPGGPVIVYFFGGAATPILEATRPRDEILTALAGPVVSLVIGGGLIVLAGVTLVGVTNFGDDGLPAVIGQVALVVGVLNLLLGGLNLLPAFPLDGGRIVRGIAWARTGDAATGLRAAAASGRWLGVACAGVGILLIVLTDPVDGLMLALCGWFLVSTGRAVERTAAVEAMLDGIRVGDIMDRDVTGIPAGLTLDTFADQVLEDRGSIPVMRGTDLVGMLGARQVHRVRRQRWPQTRAGDLMAAAGDLPSIVPETSVRAALEYLHRTGLDGLPVIDAGVLTGVVTRRAIGEAIRTRTATGVVAS